MCMVLSGGQTVEVSKTWRSLLEGDQYLQVGVGLEDGHNSLD